ncbi:MAG TPA: Vi polysaccharide biosynthesis protein VipA/TviB [Gammaproteobacteria bacterium]|nr:nucleotide sugar dehydrogenase [Gammaproteobacteria bacterium]MDP6731809.1 nucleotide sugar dehydrogenase [Gammaproteobacteria bacterium]HAJ76423.1 Vi polysaccharide biosynthesis protein VipA/TviB [Gammaproteobacteria bacterium]
MITLNADTKVAVLGLGYVGLPLAHAFASRYATVGYDINEARIAEINTGRDSNLALTKAELEAQTNIVYTSEADQLSECQIYIITAPTPVDEQNQPDLQAVRNATALVASYLQHDDIVIFESTVYPGATEEECVPILEKNSGLTLNTGFYVGYSSERVNPGDDTHSLTNIVKVTSGSSEDSALLIDKLYSSIISAGTHLASSIKVAEAAKVIENTQRDLNIALVNELSILFEKLEIDTQDVLKAAGSKWNFLPFSPGLVGGHCIGVDPYYLTYKAQQVGHHPDVILAGRRINDSMGDYVAERVVRLMLSKRIHVIDARILIMGFAFKENCPDTRNSRVKDIINTLQSYQTEVDVYDPWVDRQESELLIESLKPSTYDAIIIAVAHDQIREMGIDTIKQLGKVNSAVFDVKHVFSSQSVDGSL